MNICKNCKHHFIVVGDVAEFSKCKAFKQSKMDYVSGVMNTHYDKCEDHNEKGDCPKYEEKHRSFLSFLIGKLNE